MAAAAASRLLRRPVRFVADRLESFVSDIHARDHVVHAPIAVTAEGDITAFTADDLTGIGPYSAYPRTSAVEANQVINLIGGPYTAPNYRARTRVVFQNKAMMSQYRAVGHPIATTVTEGLVDLAARRIGMDPAALRRRNLIADDAYPSQSASGMRFEGLSHHAALDKLLALMDYDALRADQAAARARGVYRGIGLASFIELTNPGPAFYGVGGARISAQDGCTVRLDAAGGLTVQASVTEQGQGTGAILTQIAAEAVGHAARAHPGATRRHRHDALWRRHLGLARRRHRRGGRVAGRPRAAANVLALAGALLQAAPGALDIEDGHVVDMDGRAVRISLAELARIAYFRPDTLPPGVQPELIATRHYVPREYPFAFTNGVQASWLEVDTETGFITPAEAFRRGGLRHRAQPAAGRRADPRRRRPGPGGGAVRAVRVRRPGPDDQRQHGRLPGADGGRDARHRHRPRGDADGRERDRRKGRGRGGHRGCGRLRAERRQRCAGAARRRPRRHPADARTDAARARAAVRGTSSLPARVLFKSWPQRSAANAGGRGSES